LHLTIASSLLPLTSNGSLSAWNTRMSVKHGRMPWLRDFVKENSLHTKPCTPASAPAKTTTTKLRWKP
jgi:hypothetical protein